MSSPGQHSTPSVVQTQTELGPGHINLINVYELFLTPEVLGLVMECGHGGSLTSYVGSKFQGSKKDGLVLQVHFPCLLLHGNQGACLGSTWKGSLPHLLA